MLNKCYNDSLATACLTNIHILTPDCSYYTLFTIDISSVNRHKSGLMQQNKNGLLCIDNLTKLDNSILEQLYNSMRNNDVKNMNLNSFIHRVSDIPSIIASTSCGAGSKKQVTGSNCYVADKSYGDNTKIHDHILELFDLCIVLQDDYDACADMEVC